jgi:hypothetical protein
MAILCDKLGREAYTDFVTNAAKTAQHWFDVFFWNSSLKKTTKKRYGIMMVKKRLRESIFCIIVLFSCTVNGQL